MKRTFKFQWHILVLTAAILLYSLLCWEKFARNVDDALIGYLSIPSSAETQADDNREDKLAQGESADSLGALKTGAIGKCASWIDGVTDLLDTVWNENMYEKSALSQMDVISTYYVTGDISSTQVIAGRDKWLFYKSATDGNPIGDYEGTNRYSEDEKHGLMQQALKTQKELEKRGTTFALLIAPNKENVYSEKMPDTYNHAEVSSTDLLIEYLQSNGVHAVSPKAELLEKHLSHQLYYSYDTHWNQLGAYIGVKSVLASWGIEIPDLSSRKILSYALRDNYHYCALDDLANMVKLRSQVFHDETEYEIDGTGLMDWPKFEAEQNSKEISYFYNPDAKEKASVLLGGIRSDHR